MAAKNFTISTPRLCSRSPSVGSTSTTAGFRSPCASLSKASTKPRPEGDEASDSVSLKNFRHLLDGVPISRRCGDTEFFLDDLVRVEPTVLYSTPQAEHGSADDTEDFDFPILFARRVNRKLRHARGRFRHERDIGLNIIAAFAAKRIFLCQIENLFCPTNHYIALERKFSQKRGAQGRLAYILADHKRPDRADVDDSEFRQLFRENARLKSIV